MAERVHTRELLLALAFRVLDLVELDCKLLFEGNWRLAGCLRGISDWDDGSRLAVELALLPVLG